MNAVAMMVGLLACSGTVLAGSTSGSGLVVLNQTASGALSMTGNSSVDIPACAVYVNSSDSNAVRTVGNASLRTPDLYVVGGTSFAGQSGCTGTVHRAVAPYGDPMAGLSFPSSTGQTDLGSRSISGNSTVTLAPGYYSRGITVTGSSTVTFAPGVYLIGGPGLRISSGAVSGEGVVFVMLGGSLNIAGCSSLRLTAPTGGALAGVVMCQPASNTSTFSLVGGSEVDIGGTIYVPGATVSLTGNSTVVGVGPQMGDLIVANQVSLTGTGSIKIGKPTMPAISLPSLPLFD